VESLIETGLSQVELMGGILTVMAELLSEKRRPLRRSRTGSSTVSGDRLQRGSLHTALHHDRSAGGHEHDAEMAEYHRTKVRGTAVVTGRVRVNAARRSKQNSNRRKIGDTLFTYGMTLKLRIVPLI
jgi:hypothetical protein